MAFLLEIRPKTSFFAPTGETGGGSGQNRVDYADFSILNDLDWQPSSNTPTGKKRLFGPVANRRPVVVAVGCCDASPA
jgi:hypothetical protein